MRRRQSQTRSHDELLALLDGLGLVRVFIRKLLISTWLVHTCEEAKRVCVCVRFLTVVYLVLIVLDESGICFPRPHPVESFIGRAQCRAVPFIGAVFLLDEEGRGSILHRWLAASSGNDDFYFDEGGNRMFIV